MSDHATSRDTVQCTVCEEMVPLGHTVLRATLGRVCWFCHTDENVDPDAAWNDDDDNDWETWDEWDE